jgi:hypothetical protein
MYLHYYNTVNYHRLTTEFSGGGFIRRPLQRLVRQNNCKTLQYFYDFLTEISVGSYLIIVPSKI